tara:strand:- start:429 stop:821 length:393 start_codon:yes stop_codon:yes gene_type:complete
MNYTNRPQPDQAVYVISVAAELSGMHPQTLRIYESRGLLDPARTEGGNRRYSDTDIALLRRIAELTSDGLNLAGVKKVLELESEIARLSIEIEKIQAETGAAVAEVHRTYRRDLVPLQSSFTVFRSENPT